MTPPNDLKPLQQSSSVMQQHAMLIAVAVIIITLLSVWFLPALLAPNKTATLSTTGEVNNQPTPTVTSSFSNENDTDQTIEQAVVAKPNSAEQAVQRQLAQQLLAKALKQQQQLRQAKAEDWSKEAMQKIAEQLVIGDGNYAIQQFEQAIANYQQAVDSSSVLLQQFPQQLQHFLQRGYQAIDEGQQQQALDAFNIAKSIESDNQSAIEGFLRAQVLEQTWQRYQAGISILQTVNPDLKAAQQQFSKAVAIDPKFSKAANALQAVQQQLKQQQLQSVLSDAYNALLAKHYEQAIGKFNQALQLEPQHPAALEGLSQSQAEQSKVSSQQKLIDAQNAEASEQWQLSLTLYQQLLAGNPQHEQAKFGQLRSQVRWQLHQQLERYNQQPLQLTLKKNYAAAQNSYQEALLILENNSSKNPALKNQVSNLVLTKQAALLKQRLKWAKTNKQLTLESDGLTNVKIQAYGSLPQDLGFFTNKELQLLPGRYTITGIRSGYRDHRQSLVIADQKSLSLVIVCTESIR